jgi:hypothetical protein
VFPVPNGFCINCGIAASKAQSHEQTEDIAEAREPSLLLPWMLALGGVYTLPITLIVLIIMGPTQPWLAAAIPGIVQFIFNSVLITRDISTLPNPSSVKRDGIVILGLVFLPAYLGWRADLLRTGVAPAVISQVIFALQLSYNLIIVFAARILLSPFMTEP